MFPATRYWINTETQQHLRYAPHHEAPNAEWAFAQGDEHGWLRTPHDNEMPMPADGMCDVKTKSGAIMLNKQVALVPWSNIEQYRPIQMPPPGLEGPCLYVAGPFRAPTIDRIDANIRKAQVVAASAAELGWFPVVPHNLSIGLENAGDDDYWLAHTLMVMERCDAMVLVNGWEASEGTLVEVARARVMTMPIYEGIHFLPKYLGNRPDRLTA